MNTLASSLPNSANAEKHLMDNFKGRSSISVVLCTKYCGDVHIRLIDFVSSCRSFYHDTVPVFAGYFEASV